MTAREAKVARAFGVEPPYPEDVTIPPPELFPKRSAWVVRQGENHRVLDVMRWGFPPPTTGRAPVTNVRNLSSPFWRSALARPDRRCLVPVSDFCEWEGEAGAKVARWFSVPSRSLFAFAGLWRPTDDGPAFAFLTTEPNVLVAALHPKAMPVVLHEQDYGRWLTGDFAEACGLAAPFPSQLMAMA